MTERAGIGIKKDYKLLNWEQNDFPIACGKCLGDAAFLRMLKKPLGAECRLCTRPFTVFKWATKSGSARQRKTEICSTCAKINNCCQVCVHDLQFDLPLEVRNKLLGDQKIDLLMSEGNKDIFAHLANEQIDSLRLPYDQLEGLVQKAKGTGEGAQETEVEVDPNSIRNLVLDRYVHLSPEQREIVEAYDTAKKVVGEGLPADIRQVSLWFVEESEMGVLRKKIEDLWEGGFEAEWREKEAVLTFPSRKDAETFIKAFDRLFVIKGKMLTLDWYRPDRTESDRLSSGFCGVVTEEFLPADPPAAPRDQLLHKRPVLAEPGE